MKRRSFKAQAVKLVREQGRGSGKAISESALRKWINASDVELSSRVSVSLVQLRSSRWKSLLPKL